MFTGDSSATLVTNEAVVVVVVAFHVGLFLIFKTLRVSADPAQIKLREERSVLRIPKNITNMSLREGQAGRKMEEGPKTR